jgi:hypothetical protein
MSETRDCLDCAANVVFLDQKLPRPVQLSVLEHTESWPRRSGCWSSLLRLATGQLHIRKVPKERDVTIRAQGIVFF